jgi:hypothetical protein
MRFDPQLGITDLVNDSDGRRRRGRLRVDSLKCNHGRILDLSETGMRIVTRSVPKSPFKVVICGIDGRLELRGEVRWAKPSGFIRFEVGVRFIDPSPELTKQLTRLAMLHRRR